jgi:hypothetical protein
MSDQDTQLKIMEVGGFDIRPATIGNGVEDDRNPESLLIMKQEYEEKLLNPCIGCQHEKTADPHVLDYCHYTCKDTIDILATSFFYHQPFDQVHIG